jgi:hypothetical protein
MCLDNLEGNHIPTRDSLSVACFFGTQPTLHKHGIMAHRVLYFDRDAMNFHYPQSDLSWAKAQYIANTDLQYCSHRRVTTAGLDPRSWSVVSTHRRPQIKRTAVDTASDDTENYH